MKSEQNQEKEKYFLTLAEVKAANTLPGFADLTKLIEKESERGAILILGAHLEETLGSVISEACVSDSLAKTILKHSQPAGTFESRILLAHALGLIHEQEVQSLRLIQKIRNKAAHFDTSGRGFDVLFSSAPTIDQVIALAQSVGHDKPSTESEAVRQSFTRSAQHLISVLTIRKIKVKRAKPAKSLHELADKVFEKYKDNGLFSDAEHNSPPSSDRDVLYCMLGLIANAISHGFPKEAFISLLEELRQENLENGWIPTLIEDKQNDS